MTTKTALRYRVQPIGADLHGIQTETSNGELANGVHVFEHLAAVWCGVREWCDHGEPVELVEIECDQWRDLRSNGDYEGELLRAGRGQIVGRKSFGSLRDLLDSLASVDDAATLRDVAV